MAKKQLKKAPKTKRVSILKTDLTEALGAVTAILDTGKIPKKLESKNPFIAGLIKLKKRK